jgi:hypothetical protein
MSNEDDKRWWREDPIYPRAKADDEPWDAGRARRRFVELFGRAFDREGAWEMATVMHHVPCYGCGRPVHGQYCFNWFLCLVVCDQCNMVVARMFRRTWDGKGMAPPYDLRTIDWNYDQ